MKVYCYSKRDFERVAAKNGWSDANPPVDWAVISICCKPEVVDNLLNGDDSHYFAVNHENVLNVEFDDITQDVEHISDPGVGFTAYGLDNKTAKRIVNFIDSHAGMDFMVHCRAGKSRSQAVVRYITDTYDGYDETNPDNPCQFPNIHTLNKLKKARFGKTYEQDS